MATYNQSGIAYSSSTTTYNQISVTVSRTATGSGQATQSADAVVTKSRIATGSGVGAESASRLVVSIRTATGSGVGTQSADGQIVGQPVQRTATGSGSSGGSASGMVVPPIPPTPQYPGGGNPWYRQPKVSARSKVQQVELPVVPSPRRVSSSIASFVSSSGVAVGEVTWSILEDEAELLLLV